MSALACAQARLAAPQHEALRRRLRRLAIDARSGRADGFALGRALIDAIRALP